MLKERLLNEGVLVSSIGSSTIRIAPPLIMSKLHAIEFLRILKKILQQQTDIEKK
jgi:acetylornithine/N-succinyldiaminopimelate aminotransferase